jgi:mono/diheme cytochrome c family protein
MKKAIAIITIVFAVACAGKKAATATATPESIVENAATKYPGYTKADFDSGKSLYEGNCGTCHGLKDPVSRDEEAWKREVAAMVPKANRKAGKEVIGNKEHDLILKYLVASRLASQKGK